MLFRRSMAATIWVPALEGIPGGLEGQSRTRKSAHWKPPSQVDMGPDCNARRRSILPRRGLQSLARPSSFTKIARHAQGGASEKWTVVGANWCSSSLFGGSGSSPRQVSIHRMGMGFRSWLRGTSLGSQLQVERFHPKSGLP